MHSARKAESLTPWEECKRGGGGNSTAFCSNVYKAITLAAA
ncbi:MAG: hypothetical protein BWZ08_01923 [candidate division BRC1 bacterium ADurb.BinA292]|nr:MAG: hypothetical protein BWZ08_01923 [candidate division BRC1 bacterium ADurb.BinA292]